MDKELIYKKIDNLFELRKILWTVVVVLTGGTIGLFFNAISPFKLDIVLVIKFFAVSVGFFLDYIFVSAVLDNNKRISNLFNKLEKEFNQ